MIKIDNIKLPLETDFSNLLPETSKQLKFSGFKSVKLFRKSVDARRKNNVHFCCSVLAECENESKALKCIKNANRYVEKEYIWKKAEVNPKNPPIVVGFGPAGMFCGLALAKAGLNPIIIERGSSVEERSKAVEDFFAGKPLDTQSNVQFGEGGAGTFSDGKLTTGIKNPRCATVLQVLHKMGAKENILTDAKPHIGTDVLVEVVRNIRNEIIRLGGKIYFNHCLEDIEIENSRVKSVTVKGEKWDCDTLVLATGHSARDTYRMIKEKGINMVQKPFAVGVRIEHRREEINKALYGEFYNHPKLSAADYKLATHLDNGRGVYTFCMCPGGEVINSSSQPGKTCVNGMSYNARNADNSNSALLVGIETADFESDDVLAGCYFQEKIEALAFKEGNVPVNTVGSFVFGKKFEIGRVKPTVKPGFVWSDFKEIFPDFVIDSLKKGIVEFGKKIGGFDCDDAILTAPETRSSAPVRIVRKDDFQSVNTIGLYPCGEGAGYAGGIVSAAVDGMMIAEKIIENTN